MMVVGEAADGQEAIQRFRELQPDVSVVDWNLPIVRGGEVLATLNKEFPNPRFVVITALNGDDCIRHVLNPGAQAFLHKDVLRRELPPAIRVVHQGEAYLPGKIANWIKKNDEGEFESGSFTQQRRIGTFNQLTALCFGL